MFVKRNGRKSYVAGINLGLNPNHLKLRPSGVTGKRYEIVKKPNAELKLSQPTPKSKNIINLIKKTNSLNRLMRQDQRSPSLRVVLIVCALKGD